MLSYIILVTIALGIACGYVSTKMIIEYSTKKRYLDRDMYKPNKVKRPLFGGLGFIIGYLLSTIILYGVALFAGIPELYDTLGVGSIIASVIAISGLIGLMSDLFKFDWKINSIIPSLSSVPLLWMAMDPRWTVIRIPLIGNVQFGVWYYLALLLGATGASNAVNMVAGFNGIEAGLTTIILASMGAILLIGGNIPVAIIAFTLVGALLGFLYWNKYPAKVFPGDVGTWSFGGAIFAVAVIGKIEFWAVLLMLIYFINLIIFLARRKYEKIEKFGKVDKEGRVYSKYGSSLTKLIAKIWRPYEYQLVEFLLGVQILISLCVIAIYWYVGGA